MGDTYKEFGIKNTETGQFLSKVNLFTSERKMYLDTSKKNAEWIKTQFDKEGIYKVEVVDLATLE